jgi:polyphosphate glucokinase
MNVLAVDIGGTHVKILATGQKEHREFVSGPKLTAAMMAAGVRHLAKDWNYDAVSIGYPGPVCHNRPIAEPCNLGKGWVAFDYRSAFKRPVKVIAAAAMQALGSYRRAGCCFSALGTSLGSAMIAGGASWNRWNWATCLTRRRLTRIMSGFAVWKRLASPLD